MVQVLQNFHQSSVMNQSVWVWSWPRTLGTYQEHLRVSAQVLHGASRGFADDASADVNVDQMAPSLLRFTLWEPPDRWWNAWMLLPCSFRRVKSLLHCMFVFMTHSAACQMTPDWHLPFGRSCSKGGVSWSETQWLITLQVSAKLFNDSVLTWWGVLHASPRPWREICGFCFSSFIGLRLLFI